jgi:N-acetylglutamate synthase-like GNAT family acetyltransferase
MIRRATIADVPDLLALGRKMHAESWYSYLPFDDEKIANVMELMLADGFVCVYEVDGVLSGGMVGCLSQFWFCRETMAHDLALFIDPGRRGGIAAARLVQAFMVWARNAGAQEVSLAVSTGVMIRETGELFEAMGLRHVGGVYKARLG